MRMHDVLVDFLLGPTLTMSASSGQTKPLSVTLWRQERHIGSFPSALHTDLRTLVEAAHREVTGRGKPITLPAERMAAVDAGLRHDGTHAGVDALRAAVRSWHTASREAADAEGVNRYYDEWRVQGYTQKLEAPQQALVLRCLELSGLQMAGAVTTRKPLVLDLGCGSGLSSTPLSDKGCMTIGLDLSIEMLREARRRGCEVVQADMAQPLPLRAGAFDTVFSVSALQFLCEPAAGRTAQERLGCCLSEVRRVVRPERGAGATTATADIAGGDDDADEAISGQTASVLQYHPAQADEHTAMMLRAAAEGGHATAAAVLDQTHHTTARRWYLWLGASSDGESDETAEHVASDGPPPPPLPPPPPASASMSMTQPPLCVTHAPQRACCALGLRDWCEERRQWRRQQHCGRWPRPVAAPVLSAEHSEWLLAEHGRVAHRLLRVLRRTDQLQAEAAAAAAAAAADAVPEAAEEEQEESVQPSPLPPPSEELGGAQQQQQQRRRKGKRGRDGGGGSGGGSGGESGGALLSEVELAAARRLRDSFGGVVGLDELKAKPQQLLAALHYRVPVSGT